MIIGIENYAKKPLLINILKVCKNRNLSETSIINNVQIMMKEPMFTEEIKTMLDIMFRKGLLNSKAEASMEEIYYCITSDGAKILDKI